MSFRTAGTAARFCFALAALALAGGRLAAAELQITVLDHTGQPLAGTAVVLTAKDQPAPHHSSKAVMDQRGLRYDPELLVVQTGAAVSFPNSDRVLHQVYSFSPAKKFELRLYSGKAYPPVVFDKPGLVTLGCNIHDSMIGFILVVDTPWFGVSNEQGELHLKGLPAGDYELRVWNPHQKDTRIDQRQPLSIADDANLRQEIRLNAELRASSHAHGTDKLWEDY